MRNIIKSLGALAVLAVSVTGYGQGMIGFANNPARPIVDGATGAAATGSATSGYTVGLYYSTDLNAVPGDPGAADAFSLGGTTTIVTAGVFNNGGVALQLPESVGTMVVVQIRAWTGAFDNMEDAFNSGDPTKFYGESNVTTPMALVGQGTPAQNLVIQGGLQGFTTMPVPEPSVIAMGLLGGLGALVLMRRRK
jgi:PEP-CTERM motif